MLETAAKWGMPPWEIMRLRGKARLWYVRQLAWDEAQGMKAQAQARLSGAERKT